MLCSEGFAIHCVLILFTFYYHTYPTFIESKLYLHMEYIHKYQRSVQKVIGAAVAQEEELVVHFLDGLLLDP